MKYLTILLAVLAALSTIVNAQSQPWPVVSDAELKMSKPLVEDTADSEVIYWEVRLVDVYIPRVGWQTNLDHYIKFKVFNDRGRERLSKFDVPFGNVYGDSKVTIKDIGARTTKSDGTSVELKESDIIEREIARSSGGKIKAKSFVVPAVEPGAVVEFRWRELRNNTFNYSRLMLARDIPVQTVKYLVKPAKVRVGMRLQSFNVTSGFKEEQDGFYSITMRNVESFDTETRMPSEYTIKPWVLMYYDSDDEKADAASYWRDFGKRKFEEHKSQMKSGNEVKAATAQAVGDATEPIEKLRRILDFCRTKIKDADDDALGLTRDQRDDVKENRSPSETVKRGIGTWHDISLVFATMAVTAGLDARFANVASREDAVFNKTQTNDYFIRREVVAVKVDAEWKFFDLSDRSRPFGMVVSSIEGQQALISDSSAPMWVEIPISPAASSNYKRSGDFELSEDGTLEGDVKFELTGHFAALFRELNDDDSVAESEKSLTTLVRAQAGSTAELTNIVIENQSDANRPFVYKFHLKIPGYAEKTGRRLFVVPSVFKRSAGAVFTSAKRRYDVSFNYAWSENDDFSFRLPKGFAAESLDAPKPIREVKTGSLHETTITATPDGGFNYRRNFEFGKPGGLVHPEYLYSGLKSLFDLFNKADTHVVVLRGENPKTN